MKILLLAPHPFYQERGTPIAVDLLLQTLSKAGHRIDVVTFHEGGDRVYENVRLHRIKPLIAVRNIGPGFSLKKLICDISLFFVARRLVRTQSYQLIHAVEESAFMALYFKRRYHLPYLYDMDSLLASQITENFPLLNILKPVLQKLEGYPIASATHILPMCEEIAVYARQSNPNVTVLKDISLLDNTLSDSVTEHLAAGLQSPIFMYIGNLEHYQGLDLLLQSAAIAARQLPTLSIVIIGGRPGHITHYQQHARKLGIEKRCLFTGPKPISQLASLMRQCDILVSPRRKGGNTPMKIYSYMDSGRPILATNLATHTQVLSAELALLAPAEAGQFAEAMIKLAEDPQLASQLALSAKTYVRQEHSLERFKEVVDRVYDGLSSTLTEAAASTTGNRDDY